MDRKNTPCLKCLISQHMAIVICPSGLSLLMQKNSFRGIWVIECLKVSEMPFSKLRDGLTHKNPSPHLSQEALESCQTRVSKLELQQQQQQQTVQLESHDARVLLGKSINVMVAIITVILVCVSTAAKFAAPLMRSRYHVVATCLGICFLTVFWKNWDCLQYALDRLLMPA